ncbi:hypothetical protein PENTCL1PPCAC_26843, partial [Pristionchus entomophagus]
QPLPTMFLVLADLSDSAGSTQLPSASLRENVWDRIEFEIAQFELAAVRFIRLIDHSLIRGINLQSCENGDNGEEEKNEFHDGGSDETK